MAAQMLPLSGPENPSTIAVPDYALGFDAERFGAAAGPAGGQRRSDAPPARDARHQRSTAHPPEVSDSRPERGSGDVSPSRELHRRVRGACWCSGAVP